MHETTKEPSQQEPSIRKLTVRIVSFAVPALLLGVVAGFFLGGWTMTREWDHSYQPVAQAKHDKSAQVDADPTPEAKTKVFGRLPLARMRMAVKGLTDRDSLVVTLGWVGSGERGSELHLQVENRGRCVVTEYSGVAYGFNASGKVARLNKGGEH